MEENLSQRISERMAELTNGEQLGRQIIESSMDCIKVLDLEGRLLSMNRKGQSLLEIDDLVPYLNQSWINLWQSEARPLAAETVAQARDGGIGRFQALGPTPKGTPKWWDTIITPILDSAGKPERLLAISREITELKQAETELEQSRQRFQALSEATFEGIVISENGYMVDVNEQFARIVGSQREELIGKEIASLVTPEDRERVMANIVAGRESITKHGMLRKDGEVIFVEVHGRTASYQGRLARLSVVRDFTAQMEADNNLRLRNERLALLSQAAAHLLKAENPENLIQDLFELVAGHLQLDAYFNFMVNEAGDALWLASSAGVTAEAVRQVLQKDFGQTLCGTVAQTRRPVHATGIQHSIDENAQVLKELGFHAYIGYPLLASERLLGTLGFCSRAKERFDAEELDFLRTICQYVAMAKERLRLEDALRRHIERLASANEQLAEADRRKDEFLAMLAHELRNPLAPIRNAVQVLRLMGGEESTAQQRQRNIIDRQVTHMAHLLGDLLDVSRITIGKIDLHRRPLALHDVLAHAVETATPLIEARHHALSVTQPPEDLRVEADLDRLAQVVANLLSNAAKYTPEGGRIWLEAAGEYTGAREYAGAREGGQAVIRVRDDGVGISPDMLSRVFELFTQADHSLARSQGGLGIGLTLARTLVELHGGTIAAHSEGLGRGSEFTIHLPALPEEPAAPPPAGDHAGAPCPRRILVVDDVVDASESLAQVLELWGYDVRTVYDGPAALEAARDFQPEAVLLDLGLPGMNGIEVARRLRESYGGWSLLLVALTGFGQESDRQLAREAGFDYHLIKPVDLESLRELLAHAPAKGK